MAKPSPSMLVEPSVFPDLALTMPTSSPFSLNIPPPELPGLMAALVWRRFIVSPLMVTSRLRALMMPSVTVPPSWPRGLPMTMVYSPTVSASESPRMTGVRPVASTFSTATSVLESVPSRVASYSVPSTVVTVMRVAPSTTWSLVTMVPSAERMTPLPAPVWTYCPRKLLVDTFSVRISTTEGEARAAISLTDSTPPV